MNEAHKEAAERVRSMYRPEFEHDSCGVGFIADVTGKRSNRVLRYGLTSLCHLAHRGALDADGKTGDGAGILTQIPYGIFRSELAKMGKAVLEMRDLGVGVFYFPADDAYAQARLKALAEAVLKRRGIHFFGWRLVPVNPKVLGLKASLTAPLIEHALVGRPEGVDCTAYERELFLARKEIESTAKQAQIKNFYIASFSCRVISYKALLVATALEKFYKDLTNPAFDTALCVYHQRYSTNTFPTWALCQPFRMLAHNGEINTVRGNRNSMKACEADIDAEAWGEDIQWLRPVLQEGGSDSASLDNAIEALVVSGRSVLHAMTMTVPPAWRADKMLSPALGGFYEYHRSLIEPWDGPAALVFTDGLTIGACLDRNGLRPSRYKLTEDGIFSLGSEVGVVEFDDAKVVRKGRLAPGEMLAIDTVAGRLLSDAEIKESLAGQQPYAQWLDERLVRLPNLVTGAPSAPAGDLDILTLTQRQVAFGYTKEELDMVLKPMVKEGAEGIGSMGDDTALSVLSVQPRVLYTYFKQLFAQVTNPPIDPIREKLVMTLVTTLGWRRNVFSESPDHAELVQLDTPFLLENEYEALLGLDQTIHGHAVISCLWPVAEGPEGLEKAVDRICEESEKAVAAGARIVILSDRGVDHENVAVPMLMATGSVHHHLTRVGCRMRASIVCETGEARDVHQMACLIGYGAAAIFPYLGFETCRELVEAGGVELSYASAVTHYRSALDKGLLKIMSKMGNSVLNSYRGAQIFEAVGVASKVIDRGFAGTPSQVEGIGFVEIGVECIERHAKAYGPAVPEELKLDDPGFYRFRRNGELHAVTPPVIKNFHTFVKSGSPEDYGNYVKAVLEAQPHSLRNLLELIPQPTGPVPIEEVESIEEIRQRFTTAGMSLGALSPEAHECLAIAMNRIGGKSNSGEGGEDPERFHRRPNGDLANSAIKQIASGRFGVTAAYLASAKEIEIKMAQGAKPGEGGQLPGHKVSVYIANLRHAVPGVTLISPPPHHDIYSIEDLAQLIHDLKQVNPRARVCVKLVAESGVGTIAAGVAKAHADIILISGHEGGTGASPLSSVKHAGLPWELGVAETHQVLLLNGLRNRITLRTDGGMRTGEDIVYASLLGAEEYNFGTAALIAAGCVYVRQCHLNTCPVGVATLDERLRAKFKGKPEYIVSFFNAVAQEVREIMARLGFRTVNEMIGRVESLKQRHVPDHPKANTLDLSRLLARVAEDEDNSPRYCTCERNDGLHDRALDDIVLQDAQDAIANQIPVSLSYRIRNTNRSVGTKVSGEIGYQYGKEGLPEGTLELNLRGTAGQSFGAFLASGIRMILTGEANDYVGKGMSGGEIIIKPPAARKFVPQENVIMGNTVMYGATAGVLYASGRAGERFCVRNSGGTAVVEGVGDHACEYMTGGTVVILGGTGKNFGAGMTGGMAFVYDPDSRFEGLYNPELVGISRVVSEDDLILLKGLLYKHLERTDSQIAKAMMDNWAAYQGKFWKVSPQTPTAPDAPAVEPHAKPSSTTVITEEITASKP